jgi:hypothetical protein
MISLYKTAFSLAHIYRRPSTLFCPRALSSKQSACKELHRNQYCINTTSLLNYIAFVTCSAALYKQP